MAYGNNQGRAQGQASKGGFEKDPSEVGYAYQKKSDKVGDYFSVTMTAEVPSGSKLVIFANNVKNRTEKTPTHVIKISKGK